MLGLVSFRNSIPFGGDGANGRVERGLRFPVYMENPNRPSDKDGAWDAKWFDSGYRVTMHLNELACGCPDEMRCIHYEWPEDDEPVAETTEMGVMGVIGIAVDGEVVVAREQFRGGSVDSGIGMGQHCTASSASSAGFGKLYDGRASNKSTREVSAGKREAL